MLKIPILAKKEIKGGNPTRPKNLSKNNNISLFARAKWREKHILGTLQSSISIKKQKKVSTYKNVKNILFEGKTQEEDMTA